MCCPQNYTVTLVTKTLHVHKYEDQMSKLAHATKFTVFTFDNFIPGYRNVKLPYIDN